MYGTYIDLLIPIKIPFGFGRNSRICCPRIEDICFLDTIQVNVCANTNRCTNCNCRKTLYS